MKVRHIQHSANTLTVCGQYVMCFLSSLIHVCCSRTGEAVLLSARRPQLHLCFVNVNSYSHFCPCCFFGKLPSQVLLAVVISTYRSTSSFFHFNIQRKDVLFLFCFFFPLFYYSVWAQCAALITMLLFDLEKWLLYEMISW